MSAPTRGALTFDQERGETMEERGIEAYGQPGEFAHREQSGRILVVCDCARALTEVSGVLRSRGFEVDIADCVASALTLAQPLGPDSVLVEEAQFDPSNCRLLKETFEAPVLKFGRRRSSGEFHAVAAAVRAFLKPGGNRFPHPERVAPSQVQLAQEIQSSLMPDQAPGYPGWELHFAWQPARAVGGDLCWFLEREDVLLVALADVQGKGFPAALLTGMIAPLLDRVETLDGSVMAYLNRQICARTPVEVSIAVTLLELRPGTGMVRYCNAGNPPPVLLGGADSTGWEAVQPALGWLEEFEYSTSEAELQPEQILALHSDGLEGSRLEAIAPQEDLSELLDSCLEQGEAYHPDDRAVILVRRDGGFEG